MLEALGLDFHKVLAAAAERLGDTVDVSTLVGNQLNFCPGRIGRVLDEFFHSDGGVDDAYRDNNDHWLDLGLEDPLEKEHVLMAELEQAKDKKLSNAGF